MPEDLETSRYIILLLTGLIVGIMWVLWFTKGKGSR